jgi:hypothetical protein
MRRPITTLEITLDIVVTFTVVWLVICCLMSR